MAVVVHVHLCARQQPVHAPDVHERDDRVVATGQAIAPRRDHREEQPGRLDALRMAESGNAELMHLTGDRDPYGDAPLGVIRPDAWADLLVVDGD